MTSVPRLTRDVRAAQRAERRVGLEHLLFGISQHRQLPEVVHHPHRVEARILGGLGLRGDPIEDVGRSRTGVGEQGDLEAGSDQVGHVISFVRAST